MNAEPLWTVTDVAEYLQVSKSWVEHASGDGRLPSLKVGRFRRFDPVAIRRFAGLQPSKGEPRHG